MIGDSIVRHAGETAVKQGDQYAYFADQNLDLPASLLSLQHDELWNRLLFPLNRSKLEPPDKSATSGNLSFLAPLRRSF